MLAPSTFSKLLARASGARRTEAPLDWSTVALSTALSALVGTLVSLAAVSQTTIRQRRAERRDEARQRLAETVAPMRAKVRKYQAGRHGSLKRDEPHTMVGDDYTLVSAVLYVAESLSPIRRHLVRRRCRQLFGKWLTETAAISPADGSSPGAFLAPLFVAAFAEDEYADPEKRATGTLHRALMTDPASPELARLERDLRRLSAGW
ncbi:hypothetical protein ABKW28_15995 [Nocardioides sp. 31GB23]|uniref:hypothetical protein n=1 Tax=Nocardioides sp. 31GB23 TaxID=3156065 RepID=UPI0032AFDDFE